MTDPIVVKQQSHLPEKHAKQLREIYIDSFPSFERLDFSSLIKSIASGQRWLYAATRGKNLLGMAIIVPCIASDFHLLEYLAVARNARGDGIGGVILSSIISAMCATGTVNGLMLEVECDEEGTADERHLRARRIEFYRRVGANVVECAPYYRVPLTDRAGTMRMKLLWIAINANAKTPHGAKLRECICGIFEKSYALGADSSLCQSNLEELLC